MTLSKIDNLIKEVKHTKKVDVSKWKSFKIGDLFPNPKRGRNKATKFKGNFGEIPLIAASGYNEGISYFTIPNGAKLSKSNCLTMSANGAGVGSTFYRSEEFIATNDCWVLNNSNLTKEIGLFLATIISSVARNKFAWTKKPSEKLLLETIIKLPVTKEGEPDWEYMEKYIKNLFLDLKKPNFDRLEKLPQKIKIETKINTSAWEEFLLIELFPNYDRGQRLKKLDRVFGELPLITAGQFNNGISEYVKKTKTNKLFRDSITIDMFGNCFYQEGEFICDDNVVVIKDIKNKLIGLFLASVINKYVNFDFKKQFRLKHLPNVKIKLPVTKEGEPDWEYMEKYIKDFKNKVIKNLKCHTNSHHQQLT